jgi:hypothetical protein
MVSSSDYEEILTALQALTQRAYQLGRSEALKRVIEVMQADDIPGKPLALLPPAEITTELTVTDSNEGKLAATPVLQSQTNVPFEANAPTPWWSRPARSIVSPIRENGNMTQ